MRTRLKLLIWLCLVVTGLPCLAQQIPEKTLLWRIEGKDIPAPSYIYGTMHLYDQRLFNFGDSVYYALESSKGFANEIDPAIFMDSLFAASLEDTSALLKNIVEEKKYKEIARKLKEKLGVEADELTTKKIANKRSNWYYNQRTRDDMNAIVDFYLYDVARKQGKITGGIEDYSDQKDLFDEVGNALDIEKFSNENPSDWKKNLNKFIEIYLDQDVESIYQLSSNNRSNKNSTKLLDDRNIKMVANIDSIIHIRSNFFAVGAAHLAGEKGLINLLRSKGYRMIPVFSSQKKHAKKYVFEVVPQVWEEITADDKSYTVDMPGKASDIKISEEVPAFKMYADFGSTSFYMTTAMPSLALGTDPTVTLTNAVNRFVDGANHKQLTFRVFSYNGDPAAEVLSQKDDTFFRINLVLKDSRIYLLLFGAQKKNQLNTVDAERFLKSLRTDPSFKQNARDWHHFKNTELALELDFPVKPVFKSGELDEAARETWDLSTYSSSDMMTGGYYSLITLKTANAYLITDDSSILKSKIDVFATKDFTILQQDYFSWNGYPAMKYKGRLTEDGQAYLLDGITVNRINRNFTAMAVVPDNEKAKLDAAKFTNSFKIVPFDTLAWTMQTIPGNAGTTWGPTPFVTDVADSSAETDTEAGQVAYMIDKNSSINYTVNVTGFNPYFFRPGEDSLLRETAETFYSDTSRLIREQYDTPMDSLIYSKKIINGTVNGREVLVKQPSSHHYKKIRVFVNGDSVYKLIVFAPLTDLENRNNTRFFEDFRFTNQNLPGKLFTNHNKEIIAGLSSKDSSTRAFAREALEEATFNKEELPLLHAALLVAYPVDTISFYHVNDMIANKVAKLNDTASITFIAKEYKNMALIKDDRAVNLLEILAENKTSESYATLKRLWLANPPLQAGFYSFGSNLSDSLLLAATLFPELQALYTDTITGGIVMNVAADLLDSMTSSREKILSEANGIYQHARWQLTNYGKKEYFNYSTYSLLKLLSLLNTKESIALLHAFSKQPELYISLEAVNKLLAKEIPVDNAVLDKLAADINQRIPLYDALKKYGKEKLFPKKYYNQVSLAESQLAALADEDDIYPHKASLLFTHKIQGKKGTEVYYSFKMTDSDEGEFLGFIGPYSKDDLLPAYSTLQYQISFDTPFTKAAVNSLFKIFLEEKAEE